jgi:hypothetical protein
LPDLRHAARPCPRHFSFSCERPQTRRLIAAGGLPVSFAAVW